MSLIIALLISIFCAVLPPTDHAVLVPYEANGIIVHNLDQALIAQFEQGELYVFHFAFDPPTVIVFGIAYTGQDGDRLLFFELSPRGIVYLDF